MQSLEEIGARIRRLRQAAEMTQEELAERSDLTAGFISQVERGNSSISIDSLLMILNALDIHISDFFRKKQEKFVFHLSDSIEMERDGVEQINTLVPGAANRSMEPVKVKLNPGESMMLTPFSGEQFGYILKGRLRVEYGDENGIIKKGESFYSYGDFNMLLRNSSSDSVELIWITTPPNF